MIDEPLESVLGKLEASIKSSSSAENAQRRALEARRRDLTNDHYRLAISECPTRQIETKAVFDGPWADRFYQLRDRLGSGFMVVLHGTNGNGKTQTGVELIRHHTLENRKSARFVTAMEIFMAIKSAYREKSERDESQVVADFCKPALLVVDEIEKRGETDWENNLLFHIFNKRYNEMKDTLLLSNLGREEVEAHLGRSLVSRLNETGGMIHADWPSRR